MNKYKKLVSVVAASAIIGVVFSGCATTQLQTHSKMSQSIFLNPVKKSLRVVYVDIKNTSGEELDNLMPLIEKKLVSRGYKLTEDPEQAKYILMANVLFANDKKENNALGAGIAAGAIGAGASGYNNGGTGNGILAGAAAGAIGAVVGKMLEDTIFQMVVDINIREKTKQKVYTSKNSTSGQVSISDKKRAGLLNEFGGKVKDNKGGGSMNDNTINNSEQHYETNYIENKSRIFAEATQMDLKLQEALLVLERKIATQIVGIF